MEENVLKKYRELAKLNQGELSSLTGLSQTLISHIESGLRPITRKSASKLAPVLGCSVSNLLDQSFDAELQGSPPTLKAMRDALIKSIFQGEDQDAEERYAQLLDGYIAEFRKEEHKSPGAEQMIGYLRGLRDAAKNAAKSAKKN